jgi:hypothetical protein
MTWKNQKEEKSENKSGIYRGQAPVARSSFGLVPPLISKYKERGSEMRMKFSFARSMSLIKMTRNGSLWDRSEYYSNTPIISSAASRGR